MIFCIPPPGVSWNVRQMHFFFFFFLKRTGGFKDDDGESLGEQAPGQTTVGIHHLGGGSQVPWSQVTTGSKQGMCAHRCHLDAFETASIPLMSSKESVCHIYNTDTKWKIPAFQE